jgi:hypothetical protein
MTLFGAGAGDVVSILPSFIPAMAASYVPGDDLW